MACVYSEMFGTYPNSVSLVDAIFAILHLRHQHQLSLLPFDTQNKMFKLSGNCRYLGGKNITILLITM